MITNFKIFEKIDKGREVLYTFKTKAISLSKDKTHEYNVNIIEDEMVEEKGYKFILSIENTPGAWYVRTLLEDGHSTKTTISISGNDWLCNNWDEVMKELLEILPNLETMASANKYNI